MAVEIPVVIDIEKAFADAAAKVGSASKPLKTSVEGLSEQLSAAIDKMNKSKVDSTVWKGAVKDVQRITELLDLANDKMSLYGSNTGSIRQLSGELARLERQWSKLGEAQKYTKSGEYSDQAKKLISDYEALTQKINETGKSLAKITSERQKTTAQTAALTSTAQTLDVLNEKMRIYQQRLHEAEVGSPAWSSAADGIAIISERLEEVNNKLLKFQSESGSINRLNLEIQNLNKQWNAMGSSEKYANGVSGKLALKGSQVASAYRAATEQLQKQGESLSSIIQKQQQLEQAIENATNKRKYENLVLNSTANTMHRLTEQARILSERLENAKFGTKRYDELKTKLDEVRRKMQEVQGSSAGLTSEMKKQNTVWASLVSYASMYFSVFGAIRFIKNVRETTAEFELQRVALSGIIQDANKAESLFKEIKAAAIKSPFQIKELVTYTKQLSAYRVETDKLFDVTTKLADVSAGLGVDMNRLVLAYGQVKSASVLRGQELRQFTEAGIPLVDLLAKKFQELGREGTTTADVFELISKRAVPFQMVADIFDDMTEKGGIFYKMQEKQAETLAGQWSNLKDALSIMYDEIGNTSTVHGAMEKLISDAKFLFSNWRTVAEILKAVVIQFGILKVSSLFIPTLTRNTALAAKATAAKAKASALEAANEKRANIARTVAIAQLKAYTKHMTLAANASTLLGRGWHQLAANFVGGGWIGLATTAITVLVGWLISARQEAERLGKELSENIAKGDLQAEQSVRNFERLAKAAVTAADGSVEQRDAIKELQRTYGDIIPAQDLQIDRLKELQGNYKLLTDAIREKIEMQVHEQNVSQISDTFASSLSAQRKGLEKFLKEEEKYSVEEANRIMAGVEDAIKDGLLSIETDFQTAAKIIENIAAREVPERLPFVGFGQAFQQKSGFFQFKSYYQKLVESTIKYNQAISDESARFTSLSNKLGIYAQKLKEIREETERAPQGFTLDKAGTFEYNQARWKQAIENYKKELELVFTDSRGIDISDAFGKDFIDFDKILKKVSASNYSIELKNFVEELQKDYLKLAPQESSTRLIVQKAQEIADGIGISMSEIQGYLKEDGKSMEEYTKSVQEFLKVQKNKVKELKWEQENFHEGISNFVRPTDENIANEEKEEKFLEKLLEFIVQFAKATKKGSGYTQDPFINRMQERIKFMQDFKKGYDDLNKYVSSNDALADISKKMEARGLALNISVDEQKSAAEGISEWYEKQMEDAFAAAKKHGAVGKNYMEFLRQTISDTTNKGKALKDFQKLIQSLFDAKTDYDTSVLKKNLEDSLQKVKNDIKRSETARNFYQDILDMTGDEELATTMSVSVYGGIGDDFKTRMQKQLSDAMKSLDASDLTDKMKEAFEKKDFDYILANLDKFPEKYRDVLKELADADEKYNADLVKNLLKSLEAAKTYGEKRVELAKQTAQRTAQIEELNAPESVKQQMREQNARKEAEEAAKLAFEAFKDTPMYVELFANLDRASTKMLRNMRTNLLALKDQWKNLDPKDLKELQSRLDEIDKQLATKNPFKALVDSIKEYRTLTKQKSRKEAEEEAEVATKNAALQGDLLEAAVQEYETAKKTYGVKSQEYALAKDALSVQQQEKDEADEAAKNAQKTANAYRQAAQHISDAAEGLQEWAGYVKTSLDGVGKIIDTFGSDKTSEKFGIISTGISDTLNGAAKIASGAAKGLAGIPDVIAGVADVISGTFGAVKKWKIEELNDRIEEQERMLKELEYSYGRLDKVMGESFGSDYIYNYTKQLEVLQAKVDAYNAQAELERKKGKKADVDKIKDYEDAARDAVDQIADMTHQLSEFFTGTDITSAAEDFANAWIEAYKEFGSTTDAMSEKFNDMIESMINKSLAAKIMQEMLQPVFDQIDEMSKDGLLGTEEIASIAALAQERIPLINDAMTNLMSSLASAGLDVRTSTAGFKGISKDIAGASEESILGLAAGINTQNFYMSFVPTISENVSAILAAMTGGGAQPNMSPSMSSTGEGEVMPSVQQMVYDHLPIMDQNISEMLKLFKSVITTKNSSTNTNYIAVR